MQVKSILILRRKYNCDKVFLDTDLPSSMPAVSKEAPSVVFDCAAGYGENYCAINFPGVPVEVIGNGS